MTVTVHLGWKGEEPATMPLVEVGIPPGMEPVREDLDRPGAKVDEYTVGARHVTSYWGRLTDQTQLDFRLLALHSIRAKAAPSYAYLYHQPETRAEVPPVELTVR